MAMLLTSTGDRHNTIVVVTQNSDHYRNVSKLQIIALS